MQGWAVFEEEVLANKGKVNIKVDINAKVEATKVANENLKNKIIEEKKES